MEWGKAKTILIITFLGLNVLLAYQLWINKNNPVSPDVEISAQQTQAILRAKGIRLDQAIPPGTPTLREITVQFSEQFESDKVMILESTFPNDEQLNKEKIEEKIAAQIPHAEEYRLDPILSDYRKVVFSQLYNDLPMFEVNVTLYNKSGTLFAYTQSFVQVEPGGKEREQRILSAFQAVGFLAENYLQIGSVIRDVSLGYHGQSYDSSTQVLAPKWRIVLETGDIYYVHGINGAVELPQNH